MKRVNELLQSLQGQVERHPVGRLKLPREALEAFAIAQYRDSDVWLGWFIKMMDMVKNPTLKTALAHNFLDEAGAIDGKIGDGVSHMTLCLQLLQSLGLEPGDTVAKGRFPVSDHAEALIQLIPGMSEPEVAGWVLGIEELVPALFGLFLPHFQQLGGVDTEYLTAHIQVDVGDHAIEMKKGCAALLETDPTYLEEIIAGIHLAGRFTFAVPDMIRVGYAKDHHRRGILSDRAKHLLSLQLPEFHGRGGC